MEHKAQSNRVKVAMAARGNSSLLLAKQQLVPAEVPLHTTHVDSEDDYRRGCRNVSHCQQQQSYAGLRSPGRSNSTYF